MKITIFSYEPSSHHSYVAQGLIRKLVSKKEVEFNFFDMVVDSIHNVDDKPIGGGTGLILKPDHMASLFEKHNLTEEIKKNKVMIVHPSPSGYLFNQDISEQCSKYDHLIFICTRFEGIDCRIIEKYNVLELCIGNYVLSDGDLASMVIYGATLRSKFVKKEAKVVESFSDDNKLEHDQYTHPKHFEGLEVPEILFSGNHRDIEMWKNRNIILKTIDRRPDMAIL